MAVKEKRIELGSLTISFGKWSARLLGILLGLTTWQLIAMWFPMGLFPGPIASLQATLELIGTPEAWGHIFATLWRSAWGFAGAFLIGVTFGIVMGINYYSKQLTTPLIVIALSIPGIAWAAITTIIFGLDILAPVVATILTTFPYISLNVWKGVEDIDMDLLVMCNSFDISFRRLLRRIILPSIAPALFSALRFGLAISWKVETAAEIFASSEGVGARVLETFERYQYDQAMAWVAFFLLCIILIEFLILRPLERKVFEYRKDADFDVLQ